MARRASGLCAPVDSSAGFAGSQREKFSRQGLDAAVDGRGVDASVSYGEVLDEIFSGGRVIDHAVKRGGRGVVPPDHHGAVAGLGHQLLLRMEEVGELGLQLPSPAQKSSRQRNNCNLGARVTGGTRRIGGAAS